MTDTLGQLHQLPSACPAQEMDTEATPAGWVLGWGATSAVQSPQAPGHTHPFLLRNQFSLNALQAFSCLDGLLKSPP